MSGTHAGGLRAAKYNKEKYGQDFYARIGALGGKKSGKGGFWYAKYVRGDIDFVSRMGKKGGAISRRRAR